MINCIKNLFKDIKKRLTKPTVINNATYGEQDKNGVAAIYIDGKDTNIGISLFDKDDVEKLQEIGKQIHHENGL